MANPALLTLKTEQDRFTGTAVSRFEFQHASSSDAGFAGGGW